MASTDVQDPMHEAPLPPPLLKSVPRINIEAFCEAPETGAAIQRAAEDRRLAKAHVTVHMGGVDAGVAHFQDAATPNLILVESRSGGMQLFRQLEALAQVCDAGTKVIVIGHMNDISLYREMIRQGVNEYLVAPLSPLQIIESISNLYEDPDAPPVGRAVAFVAAKGGAGSSTLSHNIGWCIAENLREDVTIVDLDLAFGTAGLDFNRDPVQGIADALAAPERLDDVLLDRLLSKCSDKLSLFAAPGVLDREFDLDGEGCESVIEVVRQTTPYVVIDLPHVWSDWSKRVLISVDDIVITASPDLGSLRNAKNMVDFLGSARPNDQKPHLVLNQVGVSKRPEIPVKDFAEAVGLEPSLVLPFNPQLFGTAANNGQMIEELDSNSRAAEGIRHLAMVLAGREVPTRKSNSILPLIGRLTAKKA